MNNRRKNNFSLIEILVALPLISLLFVFLFQHHFSSLKIVHSSQKQYEKLLEKRYFNSRVNCMLHSMLKINSLESLKKTDHGLEFIYDNGPNKIASHSNEVLAKLFLKDNQLKLLVFKEELSLKKSIREEILLKNVDSLDIQIKEDLETKPNAIKFIVNDDQTYTFNL